MALRYVFMILLSFTISIFLGACSSTKISGTWKDPGFSGGPVKSVFVIGVTPDEVNRRIFEDAFCQEMAKHGVRCETSYRYFTFEQLKDSNRVREKMTHLGVANLIVARVVDRRIEEEVQPGRSYVNAPGYPGGIYSPPPYYRRGWDAYYIRSYEVVHHPPTVKKVEVITAESNLYSLDGRLLWSARSKTRRSSAMDQILHGFVSTVVKEMKRQNVIP